MMKGLSFSAWRDGKYVTLADLLRLLGEKIQSYTWRVNVEEIAPHPQGDDFEAMLRDKSLTTDELASVAAWDVQIVDGEAVGYANRELTPSITIRAVDSTSWDILTRDPAILSAVAQAYPDAARVPE